MEKLSDLYIKYAELEKGSKVVTEMEKLEIEFSAASETAREYLDARRDDRSSVTSETLTIDMLNQLHITDDSGTYKKQTMQPVNSQNPNISMAAADSYAQNNVSAEKSRVTSSRWTDIETGHAESWAPQRNVMNSNDATFKPTASSTTTSLGQDLWRQLKRVQVPVFSGDKRTY